MTPLDFLSLTLVLTAVAVTWEYLATRRLRGQLLELSRRWGMQFSPGDRFNLSANVAARLPVPGAANVRVVNLIYGLEEGFYRYIFCVEFTTGVTRSKRRRRCVAAFREPRGMSRVGAWSPLVVVPDDRPLLKQYELARSHVVGGSDALPAEPARNRPENQGG